MMRIVMMLMIVMMMMMMIVMMINAITIRYAITLYLKQSEVKLLALNFLRMAMHAPE